jgi:hypothetical protein
VIKRDFAATKPTGIEGEAIGSYFICNGHKA